MNQTETPGRQFLSEVAHTVWELVKVPKHKARFPEQARKFQAQSGQVHKLLKGYLQRAETNATLRQQPSASGEF